MKSELVFIPLPAAGHLASAMQFAELLVSRHNELSIRILIFNDGNSYFESLIREKATEGIQFTELSEPAPQPSKKKSDNPFIFLCELMHAFKPQVRDLVAELRQSGSSKLAGFVVDMFTTDMMDIADEFELPSYMFYTSGAATVGLWLHTPSLKDVLIEHDGDIPAELELSIPAYKNPVHAKLLPSVMFEKEVFSSCLNISQKITQTKGIMINTFRDMEPHALKELENDPRMPPIYTIGPLINFTGINPNRQESESESIMKWLDNQTNSSVVFLCFGSLGFFDAADQVHEIANALENTGCRFVWSLRTAPTKDRKQNSKGFEEVLPEGFLQRTAGVGKVIGWAPQVQVLGHQVVGGFVTHCGWNSVLESVWYGVPMAAWPMYAEQQMNASLIVKDIGIAAEIKMDYNIDPKVGNKVIVKADQIEKGIRQIMQPNSEIKKKVTELMGKARSAMLKGGSSYASMGNLVEDLLLNQV